MKRSLQRSWIVFILVAAFLAGLCFLIGETIINASDWASQPYNGHTAGAGGLLEAGVISDRNGNVLAQTVDNKRVYHKDASVRKALLHVIGDNSNSISTSIQSQFRSQLLDYNFIWGVNLPESFRGGRDVDLTVDAETCKVAYEALSDYDSGACIIYNYETGEIICDVSTKTYDPNDPPEITEENEDEYEGVYLDNVLSSSYTPGSIFKIVTAAAAIENIPDIWDRTWTCNGTEEIGNYDVHCVEAHGTVNLKEAFGHSCNIVFAELAAELGEDVMTETAKKMGITSSFKISGVNTQKGNYDVSEASEHQLAQSGVGQYEDKVNPMQMAILCGAIAKGGTPKIPYLVESTSGSMLGDMGMSGSSEDGDELISPETAEKLKELMRGAVENDYGDDMFGGLTICAKTGTGETLISDGNNRNDGWMVGFCTDEDVPLAFACVVRGSDQYGYYTAGQVAKAAMIQAAESLRGEEED